ncbi:MAG: efflux transporter, family, subunit [bacterium]|nr:efflux transporter, family, subunit [bacterium]
MNDSSHPSHPSHHGAHRIYWVGAILVAIVLLAVGIVYVRRRISEKRQIAARQHAVSLGPPVLVAKVLAGGGARHLTLPGEARPFVSTTVYAKLAGYLRKIYTDKGLRVKKDQVLAVVESPETDQTVRAAETDLRLREQVAARTDTLAKAGVLSRQDREIADAQRLSSQAALRQTRSIQRYEILRAPFSGLVTARYVDPGALIPAATGSTQAAQPVVDLADTDRLRVWIYLGQDTAPYVQVGDEVTLWTDDQPARRMAARVSLVSGQLEPRTRTMLTEIWFDNRTARILPGTFVHVELDIKESPIPTVPNAAIIVRAGHLRAAVVEGHRIHLIPIEVGSSDGNRTQVVQGVKPGELVAVDLPAELGDGAAIQPSAQ